MDIKKYEQARVSILDRLASMRKWGESHTHYKHMLSGLEKHVRCTKEYKTAVKDLINEGKLLIKRTTHEHHVSLNPKFAQETNTEIFPPKKYINP